MTCVWCVRVRIFEAVFAAVFYREVSVVCWTWHATRAASASRPRCVPRFKNTAGAGSRDQGWVRSCFRKKRSRNGSVGLAPHIGEKPRGGFSRMQRRITASKTCTQPSRRAPSSASHRSSVISDMTVNLLFYPL